MGKVKRRAPKGGYEFREKEMYRHRVWSRLATCSPVKRSVAQALLMPSSEGTEIDVAKKAGFREENLHIVDRNPAIVATLKRRYPRVNTYGVDLDRACERIARSGKVIHVANFDFTSCANFGFARVLNDIAHTGALSTNAAWATTLLRGREMCRPGEIAEHAEELMTLWPADMTGLIDRRRVGDLELSKIDWVRVSFMAIAAWGLDEFVNLNHSKTVDKVGAYRSGTQTMIWAIMRPCATGGRGMGAKKVATDNLIGSRILMTMLAFHSYATTGQAIPRRSADATR